MNALTRMLVPMVIMAAELAACGPMANPMGDGTSSTGPTAESDTTSPPGTSTGDGSSGPSGPDTTATGPLESTGVVTSMSFIDDTDLGAGSQCSVWAQDCPAGHKCAWSTEGIEYWNTQRCIPIVDDPDQAGDPCTIEDGPHSGVDTCAEGVICWPDSFSGPEVDQGTCLDLCVGNFDAPSCDDPGAIAHIDGTGVCRCILLCDPVQQGCPPGEGCYPIGELFQCAADDSGGGGGPGSSCEFINACDPGMFCGGPFVNTAVCLDQGAPGCCIPFCEVGGPPCANGEACVAWYEGPGLPGFEHVGFCTTG